ncbi:MAG: monomeric [FeFe] hydrogenase, partial [Candidatus Gallimonas sp.]
CVARSCMTVCPKGAITVGADGRSVIDRAKCVKCGKCKAACPYDAIAHKIRPCADACGVRAISSDPLGRASIDPKKCVGCGQCMVSCPFGAIADKSQIFQLIQAIKKGDEVVAEVAPAIVGQFGAEVSLWKIKSALKELGFKEVFEVAHGADVGAATEAHHYATEVATGKLPFLLTSCCPAWSMLAKTQFPDMVDLVSSALTPMVATARSIKQKMPQARVVFIGPCAAKKLEASRRTVRSDVDFVITFEELAAMFEARGINLATYEREEPIHDATGAGRGYAVAGGVAAAVGACVKAYYPDVEVKIEHAEGLSDCKKMLTLAKLGKKNGCLIEGMGCPGGCVAGAGVNVSVEKGVAAVEKFVQDSTKKLPEKDLYEIRLP